MPTEETFALPARAVQAAPPVHLRVRQGMRHPHNWLQLVKFSLVGGSGYVINLGVFTLAVSALDLHHLLGATIAFAVAVTNNFWWNRHWTFAARAERARFQAPRFFAVSVAAFCVQAASLHLLVASAGVPEVVAQAVSVAAATPLNFVGNKMWSFSLGRLPA
jgi:putative flippase GtrA